MHNAASQGCINDWTQLGIKCVCLLFASHRTSHLASAVTKAFPGNIEIHTEDQIMLIQIDAMNGGIGFCPLLVDVWLSVHSKNQSRCCKASCVYQNSIAVKAEIPGDLY